MKLFNCTHCQNLLYFENSACLNCGYTVGFDEKRLAMVTLQGNAQSGYSETTSGFNYRFCKNAEYGVCNWLLQDWDNNTHCSACNLNKTIPALDNEKNMDLWKRIEAAKHRLIYSLLKLGLPVERKIGESKTGIAFDFLSDDNSEERVMTGHDDGIITLNIEEADEVKRVLHKVELGERYRTLLGHFRHEIGHYYWDRILKDDQNALQTYHNIFGDESFDYSKALEIYYKNGAPANWKDNFISPYATSHPWEDWAETWAHYLHMMDTLETAMCFGISIRPQNAPVEDLKVQINNDPYSIINFRDIVKMWLPLTFALNSLNRSMGHTDFYPFFISEPLVEKLDFIHQLCGKQRFNQNNNS